ncbi:hypothetical protein BC830DRAFT_1125819 [Chytriomyces sp. MP71]|nr:hypothetical protein BC830DRAFT_1125819 [Chytriomyces sp. MP71]
MGFLPLQIILGYVCNKLFSPNRLKVPWWDQAHWWLGRFTILFAWIEQFLGLLQYGSGVVIIALFVVGILCGVGVIIAGQYMFGGPVHHIKGAKGFDDVKDDVERKGTYERSKKIGGNDAGTIRSKPSSRDGRGSDDDLGTMEKLGASKSSRAGPPPSLESLTRPDRAEVRRHGSKSSASSGGRDMSPGRRGGSPARRGGSPPRRGGAPTSPLSGGSMGVRGGRDEDRRGPRDDDKRPGTRGGPPQRRNSSPEEDRRRKEKPGRNSPPRDEDRRAGPPRGPPGGRNPPRDDDRRVVPRRDPSQSRRNEGGPRREPSRNRDEERPARRSESTKESRDPRDRSRGPSQRSNTDLRRGERDREERGGPPPQRSNSQRRRGDSPSPDGPRRGGGPPNQRSNSQRRR